MLETIVDPKADFADRLSRVQATMHKLGIGGLIVYYGGQHNILRMDQLFYLTDFRSLGKSFLLVPVEGRPQLILAPPWDLGRALECAGVTSAVAVAPDALLDAAVKAAKMLPKPLAFSGRSIMPVGYFIDFLRKLAEEPIDGEKIVTSVAQRRSALEIERVERAAHIADEGFRALCAAAKPGMLEYELAAEIDGAMQQAGAEDNYGPIASGTHHAAVHVASDRRLEVGDVIIAEISPCYKGYLAQLCRTFILGEPTDVQKRVFNLLVTAEKAGFGVAKAGLPIDGIAKAINAVIGPAGYEEYCHPPHMRTRGHGLGFGGVEPSDLSETSKGNLGIGMTFIIHPNQYTPETGYFMCGDMAVVEEDGPRRLSQTPIKLFWREN